ncbi:MAG: hydratase, partial [Clostridia bacterium]|nr:hydratase [Clostridia bacterium]
MIELIHSGAYLAYGNTLIEDNEQAAMQLKAMGKDGISKEDAKRQTMAYSILSAHNTSDDEDNLRIRFDAMASHDITYVGIIQTARASGLEKFPIPYVLTNCHNSLCAVGGTINEDDHVFGLSAAEKYGGIYVPAHIAVIHSYMREMMSGCGRMILGSDSHTRYGALGTMAIGEGGPELVKQLLCRTYDIKRPEVIAVHMTGKPQIGVGPQDVALAIIGAVFESGFVKNKVLEFVGDGIANLPIEFRNGIDVMTTETTCLSSIWVTDDETKRYFDLHGRSDAYRKLHPGSLAYYDGVVKVDLSRVEPMIALPFHPSNTYTIKNLIENAPDILREVEKSASEQLDNPNIKLSLTDKITPEGIRVDQGVIAGCAGGTFDNLMAAADILAGASTGCGAFNLSAYPASQPAYIELVRNGAAAKLMEAGVTLRTAFCGPCFGAGDVPANGGLSIRHSTRNFPNREGSKPGNGQIA